MPFPIMFPLQVPSWRQISNHVWNEIIFSTLLMTSFVLRWKCSGHSHLKMHWWGTSAVRCDKCYLHLNVLWLFKTFVMCPQRLSPWVGLRKINVSYWGWEDMSPFTNSSLRWLPGEPSDSGFCAYLVEPQVSGLKASPCTSTAHGLICEKATGERSTYTDHFNMSFW